MFRKAYFIKPKETFSREFTPEKNPCPIFTKRFTVDSLPKKAVLNICALGIGYAYLNGKRVSEDMFAPPPSNYEKTLWYMSYDVTHDLRNGENTLSVICGTGFLNEDMKNEWDSQNASWRDFPKLICELIADEAVVIATDSSWRYTLHSPYVMNRFRQGVTFDSRIPMPDSPRFTTCGFDEAIKDDRAPKGVFRLCDCEPIRECELLEPIKVYEKNESTRIYDFGYNSSGYARITVCGRSGQAVKLRYAEELECDLTLKMNNNDDPHFYSEGEFAAERFICNGTPTEWSTLMSYYGFRYVEVTADDPDAITDIKAVFVHQDVRKRADLECSDTFLNTLYKCGIRSTYSNLFYMPTDCPTREKYGWMNDAQSSAEQILTDFEAERVLSRWCFDICDALDSEKGLPGIVPTHGWGYGWGNGPVSDGSLFEQPYRVYLHTGNSEPLKYCLPYFKRYFEFLRTREDENGYIDFGLHDWANPEGNVEKTPHQLINEIYRVKFLRIAALTARLAGEDTEPFTAEACRCADKILADFFAPDGSCTVNEQTALAMLIYHDIYVSIEPVKLQLAKLVSQNGFRHDCGMVGLRHLYMALNKCGLQEYAFRIVTADGYPCYRKWLNEGATTLWEKWDREESKNHQMYSDVLSWMIKTVTGICPDESRPTFERIEISPYFFESLTFARAHYDSPKGRVAVDWRRGGEGITLKITAPCNGYVYYKGKPLPKGESVFEPVKV